MLRSGRGKSCFSRETSESRISTAAHSRNVFIITTSTAEWSNGSSPTSCGARHGAQAPLISIAALLRFPTPRCNDSSYEMSWPAHLHSIHGGNGGRVAREPQGPPGANWAVQVTPAAPQKVTTPAPVGWPAPQMWWDPRLGCCTTQLVLPACNAAPHRPRRAPAGMQAAQAARALVSMMLRCQPKHNQTYPKSREEPSAAHGSAWRRIGS